MSRIPLKKNAIAARNPYPWAWRAKVSCSRPWACVAASGGATFLDGFSLSSRSSVGRSIERAADGFLELALRAMDSLVPPAAGRLDTKRTWYVYIKDASRNTKPDTILREPRHRPEGTRRDRENR